MHTSLNRLLLALLATISLAAGMVAVTSAATQSRVNALGCARAGGQATVPAGTEVQVGEGNFLKNRGLTTDFRQMERTTIAINGDSPIDISSFWGAPFP